MVGLDLAVWDLLVGFVFGCGCVLFIRIRRIRLWISGCGVGGGCCLGVVFGVPILGDFGMLCGWVWWFGWVLLEGWWVSWFLLVLGLGWRA